MLRQQQISICGPAHINRCREGFSKSHSVSFKTEIKDITQGVSRPEVGQSDIKRELYKIDRKIKDSYNLALDAWGQGTENRKWLEETALKT